MDQVQIKCYVNHEFKCVAGPLGLEFAVLQKLGNYCSGVNITSVFQ